MRPIKARDAVLVSAGIAPATIRGEHWTVKGATALNCGGHATLSLTNSLVVGVSGQTNFTGLSNVVLASASGVFQTVGAGGFCLADATHRDAGTTNIDATLAADLKRKTTYPPLAWSNAVVTTHAVLSPPAGRDTDLPDLGYHYV